MDEEKTKFILPSDLIGHIHRPPDMDRVAASKTRKIVSLEGKANSRVDARNYRGNGHWDFEEDLGGKGFVGFIYVIIDNNANKIYLGKKNFTTLRKVEGTVRRQQTDMNWRWYISSSKELSASIKNFGKEGFEFVAIEQYHSKGTLSYAESWSLLHAESPYRQDKWYNLLINKVSWVVKEPVTQRHKDRLMMAMRMVGADKPRKEITDV